MAKQVQLRRGSASDHTTFTGAVGELTYVSDDKTLRIHDGATAGGVDVGTGVINVKNYGATGDGTTDDTVAIQAAVDAVPAEGGVVYFPDGDYVLGGVTIDGNDIAIEAPAGTKLRGKTDGTSLFIFAGTTAVNRFNFYAHYILCGASAGHIFDFSGTMNHSIISVDYINQDATGKSIINQSDTSFFFNRITGLMWSITTSHTVPAISMSSTSNKISANEFDILRPDRSGSVPFMKLNSTSASDFNYHNVIRLSNPEVCDGGVLQISRAMNTIIEGMHCFDTGTTTNHMIEVGLASYLCQRTHIKDYQRNSGTLGSGKKDIMITDANGTYIEHCQGVGSTDIEIDCGSEPNTSIMFPWKTTVENLDGANGIMLDPVNGLTAPGLVITESSTELTIASGVITVTASSHFVDTESDAASDDLDTINGGTAGKTLILRASNSARTVVCKDAGGNLSLAGDFSLDHVDDRLVLIYDDNDSQWLELSRTSNAS